MSAQEVTESHDCRAYGCTKTAKTNRGIYAYLCDDHIREKARAASAATGQEQQPRPPVVRSAVAAPTEGFEAQIKQLAALGKTADKEQKKYERALARARAAKAVADKARLDFQTAVRRAAGETG